MRCPECGRMIIKLAMTGRRPGSGEGLPVSYLYPRSAARPPAPPAVPAAIAGDFNESAAVVFADSPKASAALSRRCLQAVLRDAASVKPSDLSREIQAVLDSGSLPPYLAE